MRTILAILAGKIIHFLSRKFKIGGGTAAPGFYSLKIEPNLVEKLTGKIAKNIVITGTNGKTTTARIIAHFAKQDGLKVIRNHTGSNLERGIASALISAYKLPPTTYQLGVWELDEAAFNTVAPKLNPDIVVFLNVFRDQLDRYGEIDTVLKNWSKTLNSLPPKTIVLLNGDDINTSKLKESFKGNVYQFGVKDYKIKGESLEHLKEKENLDFEATNIRLNGLNGSAFSLIINHKSLIINLPLPGIYHIYDTLAAIGCAFLLGLPAKSLSDHLVNFQPAFGRMEKIPFGYIFLIKNPAGATQVFQTIAPYINPKDRLLFALNDNLADGTDVSWIWDGEFERLQVWNRLKIIASGARAQDMAVRLKYAGFDSNNIYVENDLKKAFKQAVDGLKGTLFILPTYTAMLELQGILAKSGLKRRYWEEE